MSSEPSAAAAVPSLVDSLNAYLEDVPDDERADALHQVFYGFYARVAVLDRTIHELAGWAKTDAGELEGLTSSLREALGDGALLVGQELFASRMQAMRAMGYVSDRLGEALEAGAPARFRLKRAVAFDQVEGRMRTYDLSQPGEHPDLPYDPLTYDPGAA